ncbi:MAG: outer membrane beta-barrel protein [Steroidobacteraceae bacterium]
MVALVLGSAGVCAQQAPGPYIGIAAGSTHISREITADYTYKADRFSWSALAGWNFTPNFGLEVSYLKPNKISETVTDGGDTATVTGNLRAWTLNAVGTYPLNNTWSVHVRGGAVRLKETYDATLNGTFLGTASDSTTEFIYGAGIGVMVEKARLRLDYQRSEFPYGKGSVISLGIIWFLPTSR